MCTCAIVDSLDMQKKCHRHWPGFVLPRHFTVNQAFMGASRTKLEVLRTVT